MSWFGFGGSKKKKPEEKYKIKLDQLAKLGYKDRKKNEQLLKLYNGDVNHVIQDYAVAQPSSQSISPKPDQSAPKSPPKQQAKAAPKSSPKQQAKVAPKSSPKQQVQIAPKSSPKQQAKVSPKSSPKQQAVKTSPEQKAQAVPKSSPKQQAQVAAKSSPKPKAEPVEKSPPKSEEKQSTKPVTKQPEKSAPRQPEKPSAKFPKATMAKATLKSTQSSASKSGSAPPQLQNNLRTLIASDIRQILINIGEPMMGEIALSNSITGQQLYDYSVVNPLLKKFNLSFGDEASYKSLVKQVELSYEKRGAVNAYDAKQAEAKQTVNEQKEKVNDDVNYEELKQNIANLISSDVRLLLLPFNVELAERLYAFSIPGSVLYKLDYNGVVFVSGMKNLQKSDWQKIVSELKLTQSEPFDAKKWKQLQKDQEAVIEKAQNIEKQIKSIEKKVSEKQKVASKEVKKSETQKQQKQQAPNVARKLARRQKKQLEKIVQKQNEADKFLPSNLQKLKQRQLEVLSELHDIASIVNVDSNIVAKVAQSARKESAREFSIYLKSGKVPTAIAAKSDEISADDVERRQLKLLSTIAATRDNLASLAQSKGVSLDTLKSITSSAREEKVDIAALTNQFDELFANLASIAVSVEETAAQYGVKLDDDDEMAKFVAPMFSDLENKQNALIARIQYLNDRARMINPKAMEVNEEILQISRRQSHRRSASGPSHLAVPHSPGESPTPHDHFPDTAESKDEYEQMRQHPSGLPQRRHSRSPSLSPGILITAPDETEREANQVRKRRQSLQANTSVLESTLKQFDVDKDGYLNRKTLVAALKKMNIELLDLKEENVQIMLKDVTDDGKGINIERLTHFVSDPRASLKLDTCKIWNSFRMKVISAKI